jgi:MFS family permease
VERNDRAIVGLVMLAHGLVHTYELSIPILVVVWLDALGGVTFGSASIGVTEATLGVVVAGGYALFGIGALPAGVLVDRVGSRRLIVACLFGMGGSFLLLWAAPGLVTVAIALLAWGAAASVYHPAGLRLISTGVHERGTGFAYHGVAGNLGIGVGPLATSILLLVVDWRTAVAVLAVPALLAGLYALRARFDETAAVDPDDAVESTVRTDGAGDPEGTDGPRDDATDESATTPATDRPDGETDTGTGTDRGGSGVDSLSAFRRESLRLFAGAFPLVFVVVACSGLYYRGVLTFLPVLLSGLPGFDPIAISSLLPVDPSGTGGTGTLAPENYFYAGLLLVGVVGQYAGGLLTDRLPVEYGIVGGFAVLGVVAAAFLPVAALGIGPLIALGAVLGVALFVVQPFYQAAVAEYTPADSRGLSYGYTYLGVFGVGALGGAVAGAVLSFASPPVLFGVLSGFAAVAVAVGVALARRAGR